MPDFSRATSSRNRSRGGDRGATLLLRRQELQHRQAGNAAKPDIGERAPQGKDALAGAVAGDEARRAVARDPAGAIAARREDRAQQLLLAAAFEAGEPDHLALAQHDLAAERGDDLAADARERAGLGGRGAHAQILRQRRSFASHQPHEVGDAAAQAVEHQRAVAQHRHARRDVDDLEQFVADEDEGDAGGGLRVDEGAQLLAALGAERGSRLVEDDEPRVRRGRGAGYLHHLPLGDRQQIDLAVDLDRIAGKDRIQRGAGALAIDPAPARTGARGGGRFKKEILRHRQIAAQRQFLMHHAHADRLRVGGVVVVEGQRAAGEDEFAFVRAQGAAENAHQRALAGAVAADQANDLAVADVERDVAVGPRRAEGLGHALQSDQRYARGGGRGAAGDKLDVDHAVAGQRGRARGPARTGSAPGTRLYQFPLSAAHRARFRAKARARFALRQKAMIGSDHRVSVLLLG